MANTLRKDKYDKVHKEGLKDKTTGYECRCFHCLGIDRKELKEKIAKKEFKDSLK